jgi:hypothetical protein
MTLTAHRRTLNPDFVIVMATMMRLVVADFFAVVLVAAGSMLNVLAGT